MSKSDIKYNHALVAGLARSGKAAVKALRKKGTSVDVYDAREDAEKRIWAESSGCKVIFGAEPIDVKPYDIIVLSPGFPVDRPFIKEAERCGIEVIGELELAYRMGNGKYIAITGTNGKTTTTALTGEIFSASGRKTRVVGNIGNAALNCAVDVDEDTYMITECSSFQLETVKEFRPVISALLNITPDHLDRHKTMKNYIAAKQKIFAAQETSEYFVYNADDELCIKAASTCKAALIPFSRKKKLDMGAYIDDNMIVINNGFDIYKICSTDEVKLPGLHNLENVLAASAICFFSGIGTDIIASVLKKFAGVEHRLEDCGIVNDVHFVNDSKGTNIDSALKAVALYKNIILIAGGYDKGVEYDSFIKG